MLAWFFVLHGGKTSKAFFVDKNTKRITRHDCHVDSEIEFVVVDGERSRHIHLSHVVITGLNVLVRILGQEDATTLAATVWLAYICFVLFKTSVVH